MLATFLWLHCSDLSLFSLLALSLSPSIPLSLITGTYAQSAAIQLSGDLPGRVLLLSGPLPTAHETQKQKQLLENQQDQKASDLLPGLRKGTMEDRLEDAKTAKTSVNKLAGQESIGGAGTFSSYYKPTRRGSPKPSSHNNFDINEHLPWMIVLLLLLVLVVIVVCSIKRSSRVLKKGPMQDPSSIMEKAIQKKPVVPPTQVKEKWIYYSNGQGECTFPISNGVALPCK